MEHQTSRERFLAETQNINAAKQAAKDPALNVTEEEVDDLEADMQEIDKHMGTEAHVVTREQHEENKLRAAQQTALDKMQAVSRNGKLSNEQRAQLAKIVAKRADVSDPVLKHLLTEKAVQEQGFVKLKTEVKAINDRVMKELMQASNDLLKTQGVIEHLDDQILKYVEGKPDLV